jgi:type IV pilus assembly protein PilA
MMVAASNSERRLGPGKTRKAGFSLIELLIVVAIILIIAAIAIPNLLRSRISAHEASAVNSIRTFTTANVTYYSICPEIGYPNTLADLGPGGGGCTGGANITDPVLGVASPSKAGYNFAYLPDNSTGKNNAYALTAAPIAVGVSGQRYFFSDESGIIRYGLAGAATSASSALQ